MAFETFGLKWVSQGAASMARDLAHIAMGMSQFIGVSQKFERQVIAAAQAQVRAAAQQVAAADRAQRALVNSANRQAERIEVLRQRIFALIASLYQQGITEAKVAQIKEKILQVDAKLYQAEMAQERITDELIHSGEEGARATENYVNKQDQFQKITEESTKEMTGLSGAFNILLSKIFPATNATMQFAAEMGLSVPVGRALVVVLDVLSAALDVLQLAISAVIGILQILFNIISKIVTAFWNAAKAVTSFILNSLWKLITLPFRLAWDGLGAIANSLARIGEIMIGMNLSNLLWNFGQRLRELSTEIIQAGVDFQFLRTRMQGLIQREMSETEGVSFSASMTKATQKAKELTFWISDLAVHTKFNAEDIANVLTLGMAYDFNTEKSKELTLSVVKFATAMGLDNNEMKRIIENFGQMRAQGKITGTELRDLARGAFVPVNAVLEQMAKDLKINTADMKDAKGNVKDLKKGLQDMVTEGVVPLDAFFDAFIHLTQQNFPNAIESANATMQVFLNNVDDFVQSVIGWRVVTPILDAVSGHLVKLIDPFFSPEFRQAMIDLGDFLASLVSSFATLNNLPGLTANIPKLSVAFSDLLRQLKEITKLDFSKLSKEGLSGYIINLSNSLQKFGMSKDMSKQFAEGLMGIIKAIQEGDIKTALKGIGGGLLAIGKILWDEIIAPALSKAWSGFKQTIVEWWNNWIAPGLRDLWDNHLSPWLTTLFNTTIPAFWESTLKPEFIKLLGKLGIWVDENKSLGENVGLALVNGISGWISENSGPGSSIVQQIASVLGSLLSIAASIALDTMSGIIIGSAGGTLKTEKQVSPTILPDTLNKSTENSGGLSGAIEDLGKKTREALDTSLSEFKDWALSTSPGLADIYKNTDNIKTVLGDLKNILSDVVALVGELVRTFSTLSGLTGAGAGGKGGGGGSLASNLDALHLSLKLVDDILILLATPFRIFNDDIAALKDLLSGEKNLGDMIQKHLIDPLQKVVDYLWNEWYGKIVKAFTDLWDELVGHSIIPDMMTAIYDAIRNTLDNIVELFTGGESGIGFGQKIINELNNINLYQVGATIIGTLAAGLQSIDIGAIVAGIKAALAGLGGIAGATVGTTIITATSGGEVGTPTTPKPGEVPKLSSGADFIVPPGFDGDTFRMMVSSGERVIVIPKFELTRMMNNWNSPKGIVYGGSGNTYHNSNTRQYSLSVSTVKSSGSVISDFGIMRLLGE